jgi:alkyl hydroperoxide reductase subunit AhpF
MKIVLMAVGLSVLVPSAFAAGKPCEELKAEIAAKIETNGASGFTLEVIDKGAATDGLVVGSCEAGSKEIIYRKG